MEAEERAWRAFSHKTSAWPERKDSSGNCCWHIRLLTQSWGTPTHPEEAFPTLLSHWGVSKASLPSGCISAMVPHQNRPFCCIPHVPASLRTPGASTQIASTHAPRTLERNTYKHNFLPESARPPAPCLGAQVPFSMPAHHSLLTLPPPSARA